MPKVWIETVLRFEKERGAVTAKGYARGYEIVFFDGRWVYADTKAPLDDSRPCVKCGLHPLPSGEDACIGHISGASSACCGHGVEDFYFVHGGLKFTEIQRQVYAGNNCVFFTGFVEGHPVDTMYLRLEKDGAEPTTILLRPDEMACVAWLASGALWSNLVAKGEK